MASITDILKIVIPAIAGAGLASASATRLGGVGRRATVSDVLKGAALTYPGLTQEFVYPMVYQPDAGGFANDNRDIDRSAAIAYPLAQTLEEHNAAVARGDEKLLESWWPGTDTKPRANFHPSSSAVSDVKIMPDNTIQIRFGGKGKFYTYRGGSNPRESSLIAKDLLTAPSIGRALVRNGHMRHNGKSDREGTPDANIGWWGRRYAL